MHLTKPTKDNRKKRKATPPIKNTTYNQTSSSHFNNPKCILCHSNLLSLLNSSLNTFRPSLPFLWKSSRRTLDASLQMHRLSPKILKWSSLRVHFSLQPNLPIEVLNWMPLVSTQALAPLLTPASNHLTPFFNRLMRVANLTLTS